MRFSEKSFEVRFCAALSAAIMPFNRNPHWIGMTQAQERITGIDTMLRIGGRLHIFQFKAKQSENFKLEKSQWRCLSGIGKRYPDSTHYIFPEASDIKSAASVKCILKHSWCVPVAKIGHAFKHGAETSTLSLDFSKKALIKKRPKYTISSKTACAEFGCYCPPSGKIMAYMSSPEDGVSIYFSSERFDEIRLRPPFDIMHAGVPLGDASAEDREVPPILSSNEFEQMLGEGAKKDLAPRLFGLFLPKK